MLASRHRRSGKHLTRPRRARSALLQVELLEDRSLLSTQILAKLGDPAPGPGAAAFLINDFEPAALNNRGDVLYAADLSGLGDPSSGLPGEGVFLQNSRGQVTRLVGATEPAPGGGTFGPGVFTPSSLNDQGDVAISFILSPFMLPFGVNAGTFRYSHSTRTVTPVVLPFVTPAPGGGVFQGTVFYPHLNNRGDLLFDGIVPTDKGIHVPGEDYIGLGQGIFMADRSGHISSVVSPGDAAPGGGTFDSAGGPWSNDGGDIAFAGHVAGDPASIPGNPPQSVLIAALANGYVKDGATGRITEFAHAGGPIPASADGGVFRQILNPQINNAGDVLFKGDLTPAPDAGLVAGLFRYSRGAITSVARPGDAMPGGGHLVTVSSNFPQEYINNRGDIVFNGTLDTDVDADGLPDQGLYQWSHGQVSLVARTGTVLPGVGTVRTLVAPAGTTIPPPPVFVPNGGAINNDRGQVLFSALLTDGRYVLLLQTPAGQALHTDALGSGTVAETLTPEQVQPFLREALARWQTAGVDISNLGTPEVRIAALEGQLVGETTSGTIWLSQDAAGHGWFVDATPWDDSEFTTPDDQGEQGRMDLLAVLTHEVGHLLGFEHTSGDDVMAATLPEGVRHMPTASPTGQLNLVVQEPALGLPEQVNGDSTQSKDVVLPSVVITLLTLAPETTLLLDDRRAAPLAVSTGTLDLLFAEFRQDVIQDPLVPAQRGTFD